ncbi:GNAT family N-acetyltransferase [Soonwooa sp.]|uniref:GNAT family N-acetyltransferase n=1 Tax=Soonwooa sp. TaxID=1938592 RepID=UPI002639E099|nr:GNAT family N-acetyltransferase [Soonwooa sp.]
MTYKSFETERLILKPTGLDDVDFIFELMNTPKWIEYIGDRNIKTKDDAKQYIIDRHIPNFEKNGFGSYTLILKENGSKIGSSGLYKRDNLDVVDIGFAFLDGFDGKGYGYESSKKILDVAKSEFELKKVSAITLPTNIASQKLIEKLGLHYQKMVKPFADDNDELMYYEMDL